MIRMNMFAMSVWMKMITTGLSGVITDNALIIWSLALWEQHSRSVDVLRVPEMPE